MYSAYDEICREMFELESSRFLVVTGLSQRPCENPIFYYRLTDHRKFIELFELRFVAVEPRMTRDFLIKFECDSDRDIAKTTLSSLYVGERQIFGEIEERENQLFVTMDYPAEILEDDVISGTNIRLLDHCVL